jgi:hypothetical protein
VKFRHEFKPVSQSLGKPLSFGSFSGKQAIILGLVFSVCFLSLSGFFGVSIFIGLCISIWAALTCALLSGSNPYRYWSKIYPPVPYFVRGQARYVSPVQKERLGTRTVGNRK